MKDKKPINIEIGQNIKHLRENAGLTQERLAEMLELGDKHISAIECGAAGVSLPTLLKICSLLSVSADRVLFGDAEAEPSEARITAMLLLTERLSRLSDTQFWAVKEIVDRVLELTLAGPETKSSV